jgi:uncharacterized protein
MSYLDIVLKTVERCNLNCSYCYFFNGLDQSYKQRPKFISPDTIDAVINFIQSGIKKLNIQNVSIILHGGEPLMQPKKDFIYLLEAFNSTLGREVKLSFSIQTNATLVTQQWVDLLNKYNVNVGVSIDGTQEYHDRYRLDHVGRGSYEAVVYGIKLLQKGLNSKPGCLTVINPDCDGRIVYEHLVKTLGFRSLDFLLPDNTHDRLPIHDIWKYAKFMIDVFNEWVKDDNIEISIRKFKSIMLQLLGKKSLVYGFGELDTDQNIPLLAIRSDGSISPTDELMSTDPETVTLTNKTVYNATLEDVISLGIFREINDANKIVPKKCSKCCWQKACRGGNIVGRFSAENRFNNPSIYCSALQEIFAHVSAYMISSGVKLDAIKNTLFAN